VTTLIAKPRKTNLRTSIVVPCSHKHVSLLPELIDFLLGKQTRLPDEIIVAISGCGVPAVPSGARMLHSDVPCTAGKNRNRGSDAATGDIIIYQDADDVPHPQRVEIIAGIFERYEAEHLMHGYIYVRHSIEVPEMQQSSIEDAVSRCTYRSEPAPSAQVTNGEVAIARTLFASVRWPEDASMGEDLRFNQAAYGQSKQTVTLDLPLVVYRHDLSAFR
jgi:hypothetical protein